MAQCAMPMLAFLFLGVKFSLASLASLVSLPSLPSLPCLPLSSLFFLCPLCKKNEFYVMKEDHVAQIKELQL